MIATETLTSLARRRERSTWLRRIAMACALVLLAGCYEVASEFIGPGEAQFVPGLAGTFDDDDGGTTEITLLPGNEYHYRETEPDGSTSSGTFRAVWLHGDVYLLQARDDDGGLYAMYYWFTYQNDYASYGGMDVEDTVYSLATAYSVTIDPEFMYLEGDASQVRAFLFAHGPEHLFRY